MFSISSQLAQTNIIRPTRNSIGVKGRTSLPWQSSVEMGIIMWTNQTGLKRKFIVQRAYVLGLSLVLFLLPR